jgi:hypothetical protein
MFIQEQSQEDAPLRLEALAASLDNHALFACTHAGRGESSAADVDHAQPTNTNGRHPRGVAEYGDVDAVPARRFPEARARGDRDRATVQA